MEPVAFDSFRQPRQVLSCFIVENQVVIRIVDVKPRSHLAKVSQFFCRVLMLRYLVLQDIKYRIRLAFVWYLPGRKTIEQSYKFPVCANVGVLFSLDIPSQTCEKYIETRFSLSISVLEYYTGLSCFSA